VTESGPGTEDIRGGRGRDTASYTGSPAGTGNTHCIDITADLGAGTASGDGFGIDTLTSIENVWTGGGNDVLIGDDGPNEFYTGYSCNNEPSTTESVTGKGGVDRITFTAQGSGVSGPVEVDLQAQTARVNINGGPISVLITLSSIEEVIGTDGEDVILGDDGPNSLSGGYGDDTINGRGGDDQLLGDGGNDSLDGGPGANHNDGVQAPTLASPQSGSPHGQLRTLAGAGARHPQSRSCWTLTHDKPGVAFDPETVPTHAPLWKAQAEKSLAHRRDRRSLPSMRDRVDELRTNLLLLARPELPV
jgi:Ca2+-binding RTX toxin-like protein